MKVQIQQTVEMPVWLYYADVDRLINLDTRAQLAVVSGPFGNGPLPAGQYTLGPAIDIDPTAPENAPFMDGEGNAWFAKLTPTFDTDRSGFGVHPDGNVPGTLGCIGILRDDTTEIRKMFDRYGVLYVV